MTDATQRSGGFSWAGLLLIVSTVGLNTAFTLREQGGNSVSVTAVQTWLPEFGVHFGLGLLVTVAIVFHLRR